mmetsp:Transcript_42905/g.79670  ORF Transcript_42905/g.79670 Transcript_42905/m.79670 type:complete len:504 (+) Transcript_42905:75-1586(+)
MYPRALNWACLAFIVGHGFRLHTSRERHRHHHHPATESKPSASQRRAEVTKLAKALAVHVLGSKDPTTGWQLACRCCKARQDVGCQWRRCALGRREPSLLFGRSPRLAGMSMMERASLNATSRTRRMSPAAGILERDGKTPDEVDNEEYFDDYATLSSQVLMLNDSIRTTAYKDAIVSNRKAFEGKVVLDVGAGTCILSIFAAQAGAKRVYAVEASSMAEYGKRIVEANGFSDQIQVIQGLIETVELPEKVDVIISEWMGCFLLYESMLDSVLLARDRWLKEDGFLFPSHATLFTAPISGDETLQSRDYCFEGEKEMWHSFSSSMQGRYSINYNCMQRPFERERFKYLWQSGADVKLVAEQLHARGKPIMHIDLKEVQVGSLKDPKEPCTCTWEINRDGKVQGFCGYFEVEFKDGLPPDKYVYPSLSTHPPYNRTDVQHTHWGQQVWAFYPPFDCEEFDTIECSIKILRQEKNPRLLFLETKFEHRREGWLMCRPLEETYYMN